MPISHEIAEALYDCVYGFDFQQTVIKNIAIQGEWGELDKGGSVFKMGDDPKALVLSTYV